MLKNVAIFLLLTHTICYSQRIDQLGKAKPLTISGGFSANSIFYNGLANREPFTYFLNGNINANIYGLYNIPVSFAYTNQQFAFNEPSFKINRLSLHPSYKWIATHIGDVAMSFSPYTLNGHQFTGFGVDLTPNGPFKISAMYGRLIRKREYNIQEPEIEPTYKRMGYGVKTAYEKSNYSIGLTLFKAKDERNSISSFFTDDIGVAPKENLVVSIDGRVKLFKRANINVEYAKSALTNNLLAENGDNNNLLASFINENTTTTYHNAFKADFAYTVGQGAIGVGYERVDPEYQTLGAYYFNNDLENITVKLSQTLFNNKLNVNINTGLQRDDLAKQKQSQLNRIVANINLSLRASEKFTVNGSYSNFRAHTQIKNQFDYINEVRPFDNLDTLNFTQISQNANLNLNYNILQKKEKRQSINVNLSYQKTTEQQDAFLVDVLNNDSQFFNGNMAYNLTFSEKNLSITGAFNSTYNTISVNKTITLGPTLAIAKLFFDKKLRTAFSSSYNTTSTDSERQGNVVNFRVNGSYRWLENHNFTLNVIQLFRNTISQDNVNDFTATIGYNYTFSNRKKKRKKGEIIKQQVENSVTPKEQKVLKKLIRINYKGYQFEGAPSEITKQLDTLNKSENLTFVDDSVKDNLNQLFEKVKGSELETVKIYKVSVHSFIDAIDQNTSSLDKYRREITTAVRSLASNISEAHNSLEKKYVETKAELNKTLTIDDNYNSNKQAYEEAKERFVHHCYILKQLQKPEKAVLNSLPIYKGDMLTEVDDMRTKGINEDQIAAQVKMALIAYYDEEASLHATEDDIVILNME
ncbi:hypothetical protein FF125_20300 [Aureibaculum algae]|uniref:Uncharacterized protein n=1 Tax=Aureibaculum algae TaxID=2584122 RepID=A0A5B7U0U9_9FLAO|nr:hypothetical protein [Aureibaculum algae]QCX40667.1 hypothetical protein FF125_20300 [Aureibaculum algae]